MRKKIGVIGFIAVIGLIGAIAQFNGKDILSHVTSFKDSTKEYAVNDSAASDIFSIPSDRTEAVAEEGQDDDIRAAGDLNDAIRVMNNGIPAFSDEDKHRTDAFENYSPLDEFGRTGQAYINACKETMPADGEERGEIGDIKPSGFVQAKYPEEVTGTDSPYLWNRCHCAAWCLSAENDNPQNLFTGTRYMNAYLMTTYEDKVADYIDRTGNHVLYRVTPIYTDNNLVCDGVQMEGWSVEDNGAGICYCIFIKNVEQGVTIDYATGKSILTQQ